MAPSVFPTWTPERDVVVLCDGLSLAVFGRDGQLWSGHQIAEMRVTAIVGRTLICDAYDPVTGEDVERRFDLLTGQPPSSSA